MAPAPLTCSLEPCTALLPNHPPRLPNSSLPTAMLPVCMAPLGGRPLLLNSPQSTLPRLWG